MIDFLARLVAAVTTLRAVFRRDRHDHRDREATTADVEEDVSEREASERPGAERLVAALLLVTAGLALGFIAVYVVAGTDTQLLGATLGLALVVLALALILAGKRIVPQQTSSQPRDPLLEPKPPEEVAALISRGGEGISRRKMLAGAGGVAGCSLAAATVAPLASLGPTLSGLHHTPWRRGVHLVDETGKRFKASDIEVGSFYTALPEGGDHEKFGAGVLLVRLPSRWLELPKDRQLWAPQGILAYSKICTHAGCAVSLYRYPTFERPGEPPAFTCPCHYSTFLPGNAGRVLFGPAGRALPQLPLAIDQHGYLVAADHFSGDIGPAWWGTNRA